MRIRSRSGRRLWAPIAVTLPLILLLPGVAEAAIAPTPSNSAGATTIAQAIADDPADVTAASYDAVPPSGTPNGTSDSSLTGFPTNGSSFGILTTGDVSLADDANSSPSSGVSDGGGAVRGTSDRDVSIAKIAVDVPSGDNCMGVDFRFLSEEFPEFVGQSVSDSFVAELDTSDWTTTGGNNPPTAPHNFAFDANGNPISINSTGSTGMTAAAATGTTYDGATGLLQANTQVTAGAHTLYLSIFDQGDNIYDSAVFLDHLRFAQVANPAQECEAGATPVENCSNGVDDDGDNLVDGDDPDCQVGPPPAATCYNSPVGSGTPTNGDDVILGTTAADHIDALKGKDKLCGLPGDDHLNGAGGNDAVNGNNDNDVVDGQAGDDRVDGGLGRDIVRGDAGADKVFGEKGNDHLHGFNGADMLDAGYGNDFVYGGPGGDSLQGWYGNDRLFGADGDDDLDGGPGTDVCNGGLGVDTYHHCETVIDPDAGP